MSIIEHIEETLRQIEEGWKLVAPQSGIKVVAFPRQPFDQTTTYVTIGLSDHLLTLGSAREVRQELIFSAHDWFSRQAISSFLLTFAEFIVSTHQALLRGQVIGPGEIIIPGISLNSVYAAIPVVFPEPLHTYNATDPPTVFVWIIPIH